MYSARRVFFGDGGIEVCPRFVPGQIPQPRCADLELEGARGEGKMQVAILLARRAAPATE